MRLLFSSTVPVTLDSFMAGQLSWLSAQGHDVHVLSSPGVALGVLARREGVQTHEVAMERDVSLFMDLRSLLGWVRILRCVRPDVVVVSTPKAGLLGGVSAAMCKVPRRVYLLRGARFEGATGLEGVLLRAMERLACATSHEVIAVSPSLARLVVEARVVSPRKLVTVGAGSSNGVDLERFHPPSSQERSSARAFWEVSNDDVVVTFVGRLHTDKGLDVLSQGLGYLSHSPGPPVVVLLAGATDGAETEVTSAGRVSIRWLGHVDDVPALLHASDLLVLPTQREGFPNVVLEAAASGLPVVTTDATGAVDSVVDGDTGLVVPKTSGHALGRALERLVADPDLRGAWGKAARRRAEREFRRELVWQGMYHEYMGTANREHPATTGRGS